LSSSGLQPAIALRAIDPEICKTYVAKGMGVAILPKIAYDPAVDTTLRVREVGSLFEPGVVNVYLQRGAHVRKFVYDFLLLFAPHLTRKSVDACLAERHRAILDTSDLPFAERHP